MSSSSVSTIYSCEELIRVYTTKYERPITAGVPRVSHPGFERLPVETQGLLKTVLIDVRRKNLTKLRRSFAKKLEFFLHLIEDSLKEARCIDAQVQKDISTTRLGLLRILNDANVFTDEDMTCLRENGFSSADILYLARAMDTWKPFSEDPIAKLHRDVIDLRTNVDQYKAILGDEKYFFSIVKMPNGMEKLKILIDFDVNYNQRDFIKLNGSHIERILSSKEWRRRMEYLMDAQNASYFQELKRAEFNGFQLTEMLDSPRWEERLEYFKCTEKWERFISLGLRGVHLKRIILIKEWKEWEEKLGYLTDDQKFQKLQAFTIDPADLTAIVLGDEWREKLDYLTDDQIFEKLQRLRISSAHLGEIILVRNWRKKLQTFFNLAEIRGKSPKTP